MTKMPAVSTNSTITPTRLIGIVKPESNAFILSGADLII